MLALYSRNDHGEQQQVHGREQGAENSRGFCASVERMRETQNRSNGKKTKYAKNQPGGHPIGKLRARGCATSDSP